MSMVADRTSKDQGTEQAAAAPVATRPPSKARVAVVLAIVGVLLAGVPVIIWQGIQTNQRRSAEAPVEITHAERVTWADDEGQIQAGFTLHYQYVVEGQGYQGVSEQNAWYAAGAPVKVCYNPDDPTDHLLTPTDKKCGTAVRDF